MKEKSATRERTALTHRLLEKLTPEATAFRIPDARCTGLAVRIAPSGVISFDLAYRISKSKTFRRLSLGKFPDISLEAARNRAHDLTRAARTGRDLLVQEAEATTTKASRITVGELAEEYLARRVRGRLRTAPEIERRIKRTISTIEHRAADDMRRRDFRQLLDATADAGHLREVDQRRVSLNSLFKWALSQDYIAADPMAGLMSSYTRNAPRSRVLSPDEIRILWGWLAGGAIRADAADVLRVQLALGARVTEIGGMRGEEIDAIKWLWTLPAARSKNKRPRVTPLVGIAREIIAARIAARHEGNLFVAGNGDPISAMHMGCTLRFNPPPIPKMVTHDLRRTAATEMALLGIGLETIARVLGHVAGGAATRILTTHYINTEFIEQKTNALLAWDARLRSIISGEIAPAANIVTLAARKAAG